MIGRLKEVFPHIDKKGCLKVVNNKFFEIIDNEVGKPSYIIEKNGQFKVINKEQKKIGFLAVDECLFASSDGSRSDCIVFDDDVLCFIELKHCKNKNIRQNRKKAKEQLKKTITFFTENIDFSHQKEAYICVTCSSIKENFTMTPRASNFEAQLEFEEDFETKLFYVCEKEF